MKSFKLLMICISLMLTVCSGKIKEREIMRKATSRAFGVTGIDKVKVENVPFIVSIKNVPFEYHKCAGFLVSERHIITTATCLYPATKGEIQAFINPSTLDNLDKGFTIVDWVIHYNYSVLPPENDIAVAILGESVGPYKPNQWLPIGKWRALPKTTPVITYGWGYSKDKLRQSPGYHYRDFSIQSKTLKIMSNAMCSLILHEYLSCNQICATSENQFASSSADLGTPLVYVKDNHAYAVGMLTNPTDRLVSASSFMSLYEYIDFVDSVVNAKAVTNKPSLKPKTSAKPYLDEIATTTTVSTTTQRQDFQEIIAAQASEDETLNQRRRMKSLQHRGSAKRRD